MALWRRVFFATVFATTACGPDLSDPAATSIAGTWMSSDTVQQLTRFRVDLAQGSDGAVTGTWAAVSVNVDGRCVASLGCSPTNTVSGSNTVFVVHIYLLGLGAFVGQLEAPGRLRGHIDTVPVTFQRLAGAESVTPSRGAP